MSQQTNARPLVGATDSLIAVMIAVAAVVWANQQRMPLGGLGEFLRFRGQSTIQMAPFYKWHGACLATLLPPRQPPNTTIYDTDSRYHSTSTRFIWLGPSRVTAKPRLEPAGTCFPQLMASIAVVA